MSSFPKGGLAAIAVCLVACQTSPNRAPVIGEAFAGPANLPVRQEIMPKSPVVATVHYGDRLQILQQRRHFVKVRVPGGAEGWVDEQLLLDTDAIQSLKHLSADSEKFPSQGKATTYDVLNVHTEPQRSSPSYLQVKPGEHFDVIGHRHVPRAEVKRKRIVVSAPKPVRRTREKKAQKSARIPLPPAPPAPKPPADWQAISKARAPEEAPAPPPPPAREPEPVIADDWTLIRTASRQSGWVLTSRIYMAIPDEVAQYAEGRRITSYFSLGKTQDEDKTKDIWLWTTISKTQDPYDFDNFRVFVWNLRRHRYETAYIQRRLRGYFPVRAETGSFSLVIEKDDGRRYRQHYVMTGNTVKFDGEKAE